MAAEVDLDRARKFWKLLPSTPGFVAEPLCRAGNIRRDYNFRRESAGQFSGMDPSRLDPVMGFGGTIRSLSGARLPVFLKIICEGSGRNTRTCRLRHNPRLHCDGAYALPAFLYEQVF